MDYLISKTKGINGSYYRVLSDVTVFDSIEEPDNARSYDDEYKLQEREWFVVKNFSTKEYCISRTCFLIWIRVRTSNGRT